MEQVPAHAIGFREVDRDGNPIREDNEQAAPNPEGGSMLAFNPFIAALWLLTAVLIGGGTWIFANADIFLGVGSGGTPAQFLVFSFTPYAVFAGIAALISLLLWHALQWQRKRA
jgi:hypothetical protein